jgi:outer membrane receptor protein involved in Fe transport
MSYFRSFRRELLSTAAIAIAMGVAAPVLAAEAVTVGEVIVTAQRRSENIQNVPVAVTAATGEQLASSGVTNVENIQTLSPSVTFRQTNFAASTGNIQIRGIGTTGNSRSFEGAVGVFIDGVYRSRSGQALANFLDIDSLQILKGPQGTLFGKNTSAGAMLLSSVKPSTSGLSGTYEATFGNYDYYLVKGAVNIPLSDKAALRVSAVHTDHTGYMKSPQGAAYNETESAGYKAQLLWEPTPDLTVRVIGDYARSAGNCCYGTLNYVTSPVTGLINALTAANGLTVPSNKIDDMQAVVNPKTPGVARDYGVTALVDFNVGPGKLHSVTALRRFENKQVQDADFSGATVMDLDEAFRSKFFSQEFTYSGKTDGAVKADYLFGVFYSDEDLNMSRDLRWGAQAQTYWNSLVPALAGVWDASPGTLTRERMQGTAKSKAIFTHWDFALTDQLNLITGIRYSEENKTGSMANPYFRSALDPLAILGVMPGTPYSDKIKNSAVSGTLTLQYRPTHGTMVYASYNRGFKAGGVNMDVNAAGIPGGIAGAKVVTKPTFLPEKTDAYEVGAKVDWLDGRARTNGAIFYDELTDLQVAQFIGLQFGVLNAPSAKVYGLEVDQIFRVNQALTLNGSVTLLPEAKYGRSSVLDYVAGGAVYTLANRRFSTAPKVAASIGANLEYPIANDMAITGRLQVQYQDETYTSTSSPFTQKAYALVNANLGLKSFKDGWHLDAWVQNLTDERYITSTFPTPLRTGDFNAYIGNPRTYGVSLRGSF